MESIDMRTFTPAPWPISMPLVLLRSRSITPVPTEVPTAGTTTRFTEKVTDVKAGIMPDGFHSSAAPLLYNKTFVAVTFTNGTVLSVTVGIRIAESVMGVFAEGEANGVAINGMEEAESSPCIATWLIEFVLVLVEGPPGDVDVRDVSNT